MFYTPSNVSIADFERVNVSCIEGKNVQTHQRKWLNTLNVFYEV